MALGASKEVKVRRFLFISECIVERLTEGTDSRCVVFFLIPKNNNGETAVGVFVPLVLSAI